MNMFERLTVLSGLLLNISRTLLNEARGAQPTASWKRTAGANLVVAAVCLTVNVWATVVILMQRVRLPWLSCVLALHYTTHTHTHTHIYTHTHTAQHSTAQHSTALTRSHTRTHTCIAQHKASLRISRKRYRGAIQGWHRVTPQRQRAVFLITLSLPGILVSCACYMIGGQEVNEG
jgi:hypothetical protein